MSPSLGSPIRSPPAVAASEALASDGISAEVIDPRSLAPLDIDTILASIATTGRLLVVDEDYASSGIGAQVADRGFADLDGADPAPEYPPRSLPVQPAARAGPRAHPDHIAQAVRTRVAE
jgi:pyruvate/2-oxoglutarate/acetoin dehydrogenase E1 component